MATKLSTPAKVRVFLVDDHPIVRRGFQLLLGLERDLAVCGEADSSSQALEKMIQLKPDVAIIDLGLRESNGLDLIKQAREHLPNLKILVFTMKNEQMYAERALRAGANGYITKEEGAEKAIEALRVLMQGKTYLGAQLTAAMVNRLAAGGQPGEATDLLSDRELEILEMIGTGLGTRQIAERLKVSIKTIESHREHIKTKLQLKKASELVNYAYNWVNRT
jgi:DNA-binding NarL/FixJ family response regulator